MPVERNCRGGSQGTRTRVLHTQHGFANDFQRSWLRKAESAPPAELTAMRASDWFRKRRLTECLTAYVEPFMNAYVRANMYLLRGRDIDLLVDTGMGVARLSDAVEVTP